MIGHLFEDEVCLNQNDELEGVEDDNGEGTLELGFPEEMEDKGVHLSEDDAKDGGEHVQSFVVFVFIGVFVNVEV